MFNDDISIETFGYAVEHFFESQKLKVMLCEDLRWQRCDIKSTSLLGNVLSMNNAKKKDCDEVIMHKDNILTEGGASNVFFTDDVTIFTPSLTTNILPGITRELLINEIKDIGIEVVEDQFTINELKRAKSIWLTSSTKGLAQVVDVVDFEINIIEDHPLYMQFNKIFKEKFLGGS